MPPTRRQRKANPILYVWSPTQRRKTTYPVDIANVSRSPSPASPLATAIEHGTTAEPTTPIESETTTEQEETVAKSPNNGNVLTGYGTLNGETVTADVDALNSQIAMGHAVSEKAKTDQEEPVKTPDNPFEVSLRNSPKVVKTTTLSEAIQNTYMKSQAASLNPWLKSPMRWTGQPVVDNIMNDVRLSRHAYWMGNHGLMNRNCIWGPGDRPSVSTLQLKGDATYKPGDSTGEAVIAVVGMVSVDGLNAGPDAGFQLAWGEEKMHKLKRSLRIVSPKAEFGIPPVWQEVQMTGALNTAETGSTATKAGTHEVTHCFANKEEGYLRFRSPVFEPIQATQVNDDDEVELSASSEEGLPEGCDLDSWNFSSQSVRSAFDRVVERGFQPVALPAYTRSNKPIHPNNVIPTLSGALVLAYCTLERMRFSKDKGKHIEYQFYANLLKIQVLKLAPPVKSTAAKRKLVHSYGPDDSLGPNGRFQDGSAPLKRMKLVLAAE